MSLKTNIDVLEVLAPSNVGSEMGTLDYNLPKNKRALENNIEQQSAVWHAFLDSEPGSVNETVFAENLSDIYLGATALQSLGSVKNAAEKIKIAHYFTEQSIERYGTQSVSDTQETMHRDLTIAEDKHRTGKVSDALYSSLVSQYHELGIDRGADTNKSTQNRIYAPGERKFLDAFTKNYGYFHGLVDKDKIYSAAQIIHEVGPTLLQKLQVVDARWSGWRVIPQNGGNLAISSKEKVLKVGTRRAPSMGADLEATMYHEFMVHGLRSVNSEQTNDFDMQHGIAGYSDFEEGLGCYVEMLLTGKIPDKIANRQIAASMALGQLGDGMQYDRNEIFELLKLRTLVLSDQETAQDKEMSELKINELRSLVIDRFFRGGVGVRPFNAVFTKDVIYARGFKKVQSYIHSMIDQRVDPDALWAYLLSARFDPTNPQHEAYIAKHGVTILKTK